MTVDNSRCVVLVPAHGHIHRDCETGLRALEALGYPVRRVYGYAQIDAARSQMATDALADGFEELLWIDSDIAFVPEDVERLRAHDVPLVTAIYAKKGTQAIACHVLPGTKRMTFGADGGLQPILYAGTGFLHTRRQVYVDIQEKLGLPTCNLRFNTPMVPYFIPMILAEDGGTHWYLADDFSFSERARQAGYEILADTRVCPHHIGEYAFRIEDAGMKLDRYATFVLNLA
jgi:hypothetical protein